MENNLINAEYDNFIVEIKNKIRKRTGKINE